MNSNNSKKVAGEDTGFDGVDPDIIRGAYYNDTSEVIAALKLNWHNITNQDTESGMSALHYAAAKGNLSMVSLLLDQKGVDLSLKDKWDRDPLDVAILVGHQKIIDDMFRFRRGLDSDGNKTNAPSDGPNPFKIVPK
jgi:ankyrin repeat protein